MKKRIFAALLARMLVVSLAPAAVFADEASGETDDPAGEIVEAQEEDEPEASGETEADPAEEEDPAEESGDQEETANDPASGEAEAASLETEETETLVLGSAALTATETALTSDSGELSTGSYYLSDDLTLTKDITIPSGETVTIDLRGHTLTGTGTRAVIIVNGTLTLTDSSATETSDGTGVVTGGKASSGGGVRVVNGKFTMTGGRISGESSTGNGG
ncbi:MAG: hypothetical protein LJU34_03230, partial [Oscillospiraceae bacterium]|nr:hypothetical protein [Oscillospiraceae bacterium]